MLVFDRKLPTQNVDTTAMLEETAHTIKVGGTPCFSNVKKLADLSLLTVGNFAILFHIRPKYGEMLFNILVGDGSGRRCYVKATNVNSILVDCEKDRKRQHYCREGVKK